MDKLAHYKQLLAGLDWYYAFSDSFSTYNKGARAKTEVLCLAVQIDPDFTIFNQYAPDKMKRQVVAA